MSERNTRKQRFDDHPLHGSLEKWIDRVRSEKPKNLRSLPEESRDVYIRLRWVLRELKNRLDRSEPYLVATNVLVSTNKVLVNIEGAWTQYLNDPNTHWTNLDAHIDGLTNHIEKLGSSSDPDSWHEAFEEFINETSIAAEQSRDTVADLQAKVAAVKKSFSDLKSEIESQKGRLDNALTKHVEAFSKAEQDRVEQFSKMEKSRWDDINGIASGLTKEWESRMNDWEVGAASAHQDIDELTKKLNAELDKAVEIVGTIVKTTMSGNYQIIAERELSDAKLMRYIAIGAFALMGIMIIWAAGSLKFSEEGANWTTVAFRFSLGLAFVVPGVYCARESSRHWGAEKRNRRIALELAALDPFLAQLDEDKRKEVLEKKADEYFGNGAREGDRDSEGQTLKELNLRGDQALKLLEKLATAIRGK